MQKTFNIFSPLYLDKLRKVSLCMNKAASQGQQFVSLPQPCGTKPASTVNKIHIETRAITKPDLVPLQHTHTHMTMGI